MKFLLLLFILILSACANQTRNVDVEQEVRKPSNNSASVVTVTPMIPDAVMALIKEAEILQRNGKIDAAIASLHRARTIQPGSPFIQQHLAESYLADGNYQQALHWSQLVESKGPSKGELCERSRRTIAIAAEMLGQTNTQSNALNAIETCIQPAIERY